MLLCRLPSYFPAPLAIVLAFAMFLPSRVFGRTQVSDLHIVIEDSFGAVLPDASVTLFCEGSGVLQAKADGNGAVSFDSLSTPFCTIKVKAESFGEMSKTVRLGGGPIQIELQLAPKGAKTEIEVLAGRDEIEQTITAAQGILNDQQIAQIPVFNRATGFTDILTRTTPGVAADANGFAHPLGEHADTSISLDGQPITDQQAKIFSNQIDPNIIQSLTATTGAPAAEFGDKTSLVVSVTTKSGLGRKPSGFLASEYGSFGTSAGNLGLSAGGKRWGNFLALNVNGSGRFLDSPEFYPFHDHGNSGGVFDRLDWQPREKDLLHLNLSLGRSWFQTPNS
ncbi:MAG: hypothetical protein ACJ73N_16465 [Bryobacteraceae bacterium]